jgi:predicted nucleic acid-binding protein
VPKAVIADTSCLIVLANIHELELLRKLYGEILTTTIVALEFREPLPEWIEIMDARNTDRQDELALQLDRGEASAIALALEIPDSTIILDDQKARVIASALGLHITGTLGTIVKAKHDGIIPSIKPLLEKLVRANFRITEELVQQALHAAGEE